MAAAKNMLDFLTPARIHEKRRMEAFFSALPQAYCGWGPDGTVMTSRGFCRLFDIPGVRTIHDIENALDPSDAAALDAQFLVLERAGHEFDLDVRTHGRNRTVRISGKIGRDLSMQGRYIILWAQDVTIEALARTELQNDAETSKQALERIKDERDVLPWAVWNISRDGALLWVNKHYANIVRKDRDDIVKEQTLLPVTLPGSQDPAPASFIKLYEQARETGQAQRLRGRLILDGQRRILDVIAVPSHTSGSLLCVGLDVTAEEEHIAAHKRYTQAQEKLLEQLNTAIAIFAADQKLEFFNTAFARLWGLDDSWLNTHPKLGDMMERLREARRLPEQADFRSFKKAWLDMFTSLLHPHEDMLYLPDGSAVRMLAAPHATGGLMMTFEDVTSRLALESSYNTLMAVQRETLDNLAEGVAVFGPDGRLKLSNPSFLRLWQLNPEELVGEPHISRICEKMLRFFNMERDGEGIRTLLLSHALERHAIHHSLRRDDGMVLDCSTVPLPDGGVMVTYRDITDTTRVNDALSEKNRALEDAEKLKTDFLANVSYQLRTPLSTIMGFAEILDNEYFGPLNERQKEYATGIGDSSQRLMTLIDDILDLSTIEAGYLSLKIEAVNVSNLLDDVLALTREWAGRETLQVSLTVDDSAGVLHADARRLKQALINLVRNAIAYTPGGGAITIAASGDSDVVTLAVLDTGIGIPEADMARVFEPFQRVAVSGRQPTGPGLGLSLVKNIVELHKGHVTLDSALGKGTTVTISLPRDPSAVV